MVCDMTRVSDIVIYGLRSRAAYRCSGFSAAAPSVGRAPEWEAGRMPFRDEINPGYSKLQMRYRGTSGTRQHQQAPERCTREGGSSQFPLQMPKLEDESSWHSGSTSMLADRASCQIGEGGWHRGAVVKVASGWRGWWLRRQANSVRRRRPTFSAAGSARAALSQPPSHRMPRCWPCRRSLLPMPSPHAPQAYRSGLHGHLHAPQASTIHASTAMPK